MTKRKYRFCMSDEEAFADSPFTRGQCGDLLEELDDIFGVYDDEESKAYFDRYIAGDR